VVLEKKILKHFESSFTLLLLSPLEKGPPLHLNKLESPSPKDDYKFGYYSGFSTP
jgi:hypothetical protein